MYAAPSPPRACSLIFLHKGLELARPSNRRRLATLSGAQVPPPLVVDSPGGSPSPTPPSWQAQDLPAELPIDPDSPVADMLGRLVLPVSTAIEVSHELWPERVEDSQDVLGYLVWHEKVCPGGILHQNGGLYQRADLHARGKSIGDISQALILMMDRFHGERGDLGQIFSTDSQPPGGAVCSSFNSLEPFFNPVRYFGM